MDEKKYIRTLETHLLSAEKSKVKLTYDWANKFSVNAGIYLAWEGDNIVYAGETGSLRGRMRDLLDTRHHNLRRHIGYDLFGETASTTKKFKDEKALNTFIEENIYITCMTVKLGRKELEESLIAKFNPKYNRKGQRGK